MAWPGSSSSRATRPCCTTLPKRGSRASRRISSGGGPTATGSRSGRSRVTTASQWLQGARPRTLAISVAPVLVGTAAASIERPVIWWRAFAALVVALALQVGVNYANDYSDGIRGTDRERRGPLRLTASGGATPQAGRLAAAALFAVAGVLGPGVSGGVVTRLPCG